MVKNGDRITAPRLWLVIFKSHRALSLLAEQSIANTGLCLTDFAAVDRLERLGLVVRKSSPSDRRARVVELTAKGKRLVASSFKRHAKDLEELMSPLSGKEKEQIYGPLKKLGLLAADKLEEQHAKSKSSKERPTK